MNRFISVLILFSLFVFSEQKVESTILDLDSSDWSLDSENGVYYQIGLSYCTNVTNIEYQTMAIYAPKEYLTCTQTGEKYKCEINKSGKKGSYTASNAPIVIPVETPGYAAMKAPTTYDYETVSKFVSNGLVFAYAGCRGRYEKDVDYTEGAPWPVTDLKSAIRYMRYNKKLIPGDTGKIYTFGMSGGGAQSCLVGITGNSDLYTQYLALNGAAMKDADGNDIKDNVKGSQCWCPITNLDTADLAYEWNMGQYYSTGTRAEGTFTKLLSDDLANEYVKYINNIKLKDPKGKELSLDEINSGSYYNYLKSVIEESLNNFLSDTTFPWTPQPNPGPGPGLRPGSNEELKDETSYNTAEDYIAYLNEGNQWITYDKSKNKATISSVGDFVKKCKNAKKNVGAFDDLNRTQAENNVFGTAPGENYQRHFDKILTDLLNKNKDKYAEKSNWDEDLPTEYSNDLEKEDSLGNKIQYRVNMYNPMYYLNNYYEGYKKSDVADYFRINTGIFQSDTGNVVEMNLYLALINYGKKVEFTTVWEQQHVKAERNGGDSDTNFINWISGIEKNFSGWINLSYLVYLVSLLLLL